MSGLVVSLAFVGLLVGTEAFFSFLSVLNRRHEERTVDAERAWVTEELGIDDPDEVLDYNRARTGLSLLGNWTGLGAILLVLFSGLFVDAVAWLQGTGWNPLLQGAAFVAGAILLAQVASAPFGLFGTFVVEEIFGFNNRSPGLWLRDTVLSTVVTLVLTVPIAVAIFWFVDAVPVWPAAAWALVVGFTVAMLVLKPRVIDPLFYEFTKIEEGDLREAVDDVFERVGFVCEQVYEMDASTRSSHSSAYFVGFGRTKRVVLFDTLVDGMDTEAIQGVLAHELAHYKKGHVWKFVGLFAVRFAVVFAVLGYLVSADWLYAPFWVPETTYAGLAVALLWLWPVMRLTSPVDNYLSLSFEREADAFAASHTSGAALARALSDLAADNLASLFPHPWYETFHHDHPPIPERVRYLREMDSGSDGPDPASGLSAGD